MQICSKNAAIEVFKTFSILGKGFYGFNFA
jgi:hypothetical protein